MLNQFFNESPLCVVGTTKIKNLDDNVGSVRVKLTKEDIKEISDAVAVHEIAGNKTTDNFMEVSWRYANTPLPKDTK